MFTKIESIDKYLEICIELVRKGMAELVIYQKRRPFIHQTQLLEAQEQAKKKKLTVLFYEIRTFFGQN
jgi:hypothetical protein